MIGCAVDIRTIAQSHCKKTLLSSGLANSGLTPLVTIPDIRIHSLKLVNLELPLVGKNVRLGSHAQVARLNRPQILLIRLCVRRILVQQIWCARLHLRIQDLEPELLRRHRLLGPPLPLIAEVEITEGLTPDICQTRRLIRAEQ